MQFIYDKNAGNANLLIKSRAFHHIFNVRRKNVESALKNGEIFNFANLNDGAIHRYKIIRYDKKSAEFEWLESAHIAQDSPKTHIIQAVIADFDKILPFLNELFVEKITLFYADFSQKNIRINLERIKSILINSSMQCGRLSAMKVEIFNSLDEVMCAYSDLVALDFGAECADLRELNHFVIGPEGGFSQRERKMFSDSNETCGDLHDFSANQSGDSRQSDLNAICDSKQGNSNKIRAVGINHPLILRSQSASIFVASQKI